MSVNPLAAARRLAVAGLLGAVVPMRLAAQAVTVGPTRVISADVPADPHGESFLAISPRDPRVQLATAVRISERDGSGSSAYRSSDGGVTWSRVILPPGARKVSTGWDAIAYFDAKGNAYFGANDGGGLYITRSEDGGRTWSDATTLMGARGFDRQYMGFDATGRFAGRIYAGASVNSTTLDSKGVAALAVAYSTDSARTFSPPSLIGSLPNEKVYTFVNMLVTADGTVLLPFLTRIEPEQDYGSLFEARDSTKPTPVFEARLNLRVAVSGDGGRSYSISPIGVSYRERRGRTSLNVQGNGNTAIDLSHGPYAGRIYFVWVDDAGDRHDIRVAHSSDNGQTWSKPVTVNDNTRPAQHANPTLAVNDRGVVGVTWNDRRNSDTECYELYFAASLDGGETFTPNVTPAGRRPTCSFARGNWVPGAHISPYPSTTGGHSVEGQGLNVLMIATRFPGGGDTQGLASDGDGVFHAAWIDGTNGVMQLASTSFTVAGDAHAPMTAAESDVSTQVKLVAERCRFDWNASTFGCDMHLENRSPLTVTGPFAVELQSVRVNLIGYGVADADNKRGGPGARWSFTLPSGASLAPGASSNHRPFTWHFTGVPAQPEYPFMMFKVVAARPTSASARVSDDARATPDRR